MRQRLTHLLVLLLVVASLAGCRGGAKPDAPAAPEVTALEALLADPGQQGALAALKEYAGARKGLDFGRAYKVLTPSARAAFTAEEFAAAYQGQKSYAYTGLEVGPPTGGEARGYVLGVAMVREATYRFARYPYTLLYQQGRWGVAHGSGLGPKALRAFDAGRFDENLALADQWLAIDPQAWEPYLERFYVYKDTDRHAEAVSSWEKALALAPPEEHPHLYDTLSMLYTLTRQGDKLLDSADKALAAANQLGKEHAERYNLFWRAGVVIDKAFAYRFKGDRQAAIREYQEAKALDPYNRDVERFERFVD